MVPVLASTGPLLPVGESGAPDQTGLLRKVGFVLFVPEEHSSGVAASRNGVELSKNHVNLGRLSMDPTGYRRSFVVLPLGLRWNIGGTPWRLRF